MVIEVVAAVSVAEGTDIGVEIPFIMAATTAIAIFPTTSEPVLMAIGVAETAISTNHATKDHLAVTFFTTARETPKSPNSNHRLGEQQTTSKRSNKSLPSN